ncbi:hypothetical protein [Lysobacter antibioticus]|uniref:hypothetical protein n=1 Tax=Lysobacter antibioticus TaxID=84531 RepID=UPI00034AAAB1|nr:hypothetical protein [Lysobacter antibioticus]
MGTVTEFPTNPKTLHVIRKGINERARNTGVSDDIRRHAISIGLSAAMHGRSVGGAIQEGCNYLRRAIHSGFSSNGPEAA